LGSGPFRAHFFIVCALKPALQLRNIYGEFVSISLFFQHTTSLPIMCALCFAHCFGRHTLLQTLLAHRRWLKNSKSKAGASAKKEHGD